MGAIWGADADSLDELSAAMGRLAESLDRSRGQLGLRVHTVPWRGAEADRFRHDWDATHARSLLHAIAFLREASVQVANNAQQQREASGLAGSGLSGAVSLGVGVMPPSVAAVLTALLGPGWRSALPANPTPAEVANLLHRVAQVEHWLKDPSIGLQGRASWGASGEVGTQGHGTVGGAEWQAYAKASYQVGAEGHASMKLTPAELSILAGGSVGLLATASAGGSLAFGPGTARGGVDVTAQARAYADGSAVVNMDGVKASAEAGAIAGVSATAHGDLDVPGVGAGGAVTGYAGAGVVVKANAEVTLQHVGATVKLGAALGLGASAEFHVSVEPVKIANELNGEAGRLTGFLHHTF